MAKVIDHQKLKEHKRNLQALKILINQYIKDGKTEAVEKVKKEQGSVSDGKSYRDECLDFDRPELDRNHR